MTATTQSYAALARTLAPAGGDDSAFRVFDLPVPAPALLREEHTALFGRAGRAVVSPYEGVHRGTGVRQVLAAYAAEGFAPDPAFRDRPDHVCVELAFMGSVAGGGSSARDFFLGHIWPWVPAFFDALARTEGFAHHRALAGPAARFLRREAARHRAAPREPQPKPPAAVEPLCTTCGAPLGITPPPELHPPWGSVCLRCRLQKDLRSLHS